MMNQNSLFMSEIERANRVNRRKAALFQFGAFLLATTFSLYLLYLYRNLFIPSFLNEIFSQLLSLFLRLASFEYGQLSEKQLRHSADYFIWKIIPAFVFIGIFSLSWSFLMVDNSSNTDDDTVDEKKREGLFDEPPNKWKEDPSRGNSSSHHSGHHLSNSHSSYYRHRHSPGLHSPFSVGDSGSNRSPSTRSARSGSVGAFSQRSRANSSISMDSSFSHTTASTAHSYTPSISLTGTLHSHQKSSDGKKKPIGMYQQWCLNSGGKSYHTNSQWTNSPTFTPSGTFSSPQYSNMHSGLKYQQATTAGHGHSSPPGAQLPKKIGEYLRMTCDELRELDIDISPHNFYELCVPRLENYIGKHLSGIIKRFNKLIEAIKKGCENDVKAEAMIPLLSMDRSRISHGIHGNLTLVDAYEDMTSTAFKARYVENVTQEVKPGVTAPGGLAPLVFNTIQQAPTEADKKIASAKAMNFTDEFSEILDLLLCCVRVVADPHSARVGSRSHKRNVPFTSEEGDAMVLVLARIRELIEEQSSGGKERKESSVRYFRKMSWSSPSPGAKGYGRNYRSPGDNSHFHQKQSAIADSEIFVAAFFHYWESQLDQDSDKGFVGDHFAESFEHVKRGFDRYDVGIVRQQRDVEPLSAIAAGGAISPVHRYHHQPASSTGVNFNVFAVSQGAYPIEFKLDPGRGNCFNAIVSFIILYIAKVSGRENDSEELSDKLISFVQELFGNQKDSARNASSLWDLLLEDSVIAFRR